MNGTAHAYATEAQLIDCAILDPTFRAELQADPVSVFQRHLGADVSETVLLEVLEELASTVTVLPRHAAGSAARLPDILEVSAWPTTT